MIKNFLINLRRKPKSVRDRVAVFVASIFTGCVALMWLILSPGFVNSQKLANKDKPAFSDFFGNMSGQLSNIKSAFGSKDQGKDFFNQQYGSVSVDEVPEEWLLGDLSDSEEKIEEDSVTLGAETGISGLLSDDDSKENTIDSLDNLGKKDSKVGEEVYIITTQAKKPIVSTSTPE